MVAHNSKKMDEQLHHPLSLTLPHPPSPSLTHTPLPPTPPHLPTPLPPTLLPHTPTVLLGTNNARTDSLTNVTKKGKEGKKALIDNIRDAVTEYPNIMVIKVSNMRNQSVKELRLQWRVDSRLFFGKLSVIRVALGRDETEELAEGLSALGARLEAGCGLLFTHKSLDEVNAHFETMAKAHFARAGATVTETITVEGGQLTQFAHPLEPRLRALGLPTRLDRGIIELLETVDICTAGDTLTAEQAHLLKLFGHKLAIFSIKAVAVWTIEDGYTEL